MTMIRPIRDLSAGDHIAVDSDHEIASGSYTVAEYEVLDDGKVRLSLTPDVGGEPIDGVYDGGVDVGVN